MRSEEDAVNNLTVNENSIKKFEESNRQHPIVMIQKMNPHAYSTILMFNKGDRSVPSNFREINLTTK